MEALRRLHYARFPYAPPGIAPLEVPLRVLVVGDFGARGATDEPTVVTSSTLDRVLGAMDVALPIGPQLRPLLRFAALADFEPSALASQLPRVGERVAALHHPAFLRLEATWRGVALIVERAVVHPAVRIELLHVPAHELPAFIGPHDPDEPLSPLARRLLAPSCTQGDAPYGLLVLDHAFGGAPRDAVIASAAAIAARAHVPIATGAAPSILGIDTFAALPPREGAEAFAASAPCAWLRAVRQYPYARMVALCMPRVALREAPMLEHEGAEGRALANAAYVLAAAVVGTFVRGPSRGEERIAGAPEVAIGERLAFHLNEAGLAVATAGREGGCVTFSWVASAAEARASDTDKDFELSMFLARLAQHVKVLYAREAPRARTREAIERVVDDWVGAHCSHWDRLHLGPRAPKPLFRGSATVRDDGAERVVGLSVTPNWKSMAGWLTLETEIRFPRAGA